MYFMTKCNYIYTKTHRKQRWILVNRIMIWGWFGFENTGDDPLLKTMLSFLVKKENIITGRLYNQLEQKIK